MRGILATAGVVLSTAALGQAPTAVKFDGAEVVASAADSYAVFTWPGPGEPRAWPTVGGERRVGVYRLPATTTPVEAQRDYAQALAAAGYSIVARCQSEACFDERYKRHFDGLVPPALAAERGWPTSSFELTFVTEPHMLYAQRGSAGARSLVVVLVGRGRVDHGYPPARGAPLSAVVTLTERPPTTGKAAVVSAADLEASLAQDGRRALYGIQFDTDSATLRAESQPQLAALVAYLKANPTASVYVVGHTDMTASLEHNLDLSERRAQAVAAALVQAGIPSTRVTARGVGPLAPVASNAQESGRALNRRVEIVAR